MYEHFGKIRILFTVIQKYQVYHNMFIEGFMFTLEFQAALFNYKMFLKFIQKEEKYTTQIIFEKETVKCLFQLISHLPDSHNNQDSRELDQGQDAHGWIQTRSSDVHLFVCR